MKNVLITKADGSSVNASVICYFKVNDARYVYYTLNELSQDPTNQTIKIYVAKEKTDNPAVDVPITEEDWTILKGYMSDVLKDAPLAGVEYLPSKENMIIVDEKGIAMPTSYDYVNKHAKVYQDAVSSSEDAGSANVDLWIKNGHPLFMVNNIRGTLDEMTASGNYLYSYIKDDKMVSIYVEDPDMLEFIII